MLKQLRTAFMALLTLTLLTGVLYPLLVTGFAKLAFAHKAEGSLVEHDGHVLGSQLIGQAFDDPGYFWSRLSATGPNPYNAGASAGSNLGPTNPALADAAKARAVALRAADPANTAPIPVDLVTASGSGLDPHISPAAARYQIARIARVRGLAEARVAQLVEVHTEAPDLGFLGEARVNVVALNRALDVLTPPH